MPPKETNPKNFKIISFPGKELPGMTLSRYRVYKDAKNFVLVEAENAQIALEKSGLKNPARILRDTLSLHTIVTREGMNQPAIDIVDKVAAEAIAAPAAVTQTPAAPAETAPLPEQPAAENKDASLSPEEVDKLLKS